VENILHQIFLRDVNYVKLFLGLDSETEENFSLKSWHQIRFIFSESQEEFV